MSRILPVVLLLFFCYTSRAQTSWELLNPTPSYEAGKKVVFTSADKGFIITQKDLLYTVDAGATWNKKMDLPGANDIHFLGDLGYMAGSNGSVYVSKDGGDTWAQVNTGSNENFNTVQIINETTIVLTGSNSIVRTDDGGATWQDHIVEGYYKVNKTFFTSPLTGHAVCNGGFILKTSDGGKTWKVTESTNTFPNDFFAVYFVNENTGFASKQHDALLKTSDGGETWQKMGSTTDAFYTFFFLDESTGYAAGEHGAVYKTLDGGKTWKWISFQDARISHTSIYGIHFQNTGVGFVVGDRGMIYKTTDGGSTWQPNSPFYTDVQNLQFVSGTVGYASNYTDLLKTTDGGKTWNKMGSPLEGAGIFKLEFLDENTGYATVGVHNYVYEVFKTVDGGVTWVQTNNGMEIMRDNLYSLKFIDENVGFVSGGYNQKGVFKTTNGGDSWLIVEDLSFGEMQFPDETTGYGMQVHQMLKRIFRTTDSGENWEVVLETEDNLTSMYFVTKEVGYVTAEYGIMYKTTDGGESWSKLDVPYNDYMHVKFFNENIGYVLDDSNGIWKTVNAGYSWERISFHWGIKAIDITEEEQIFLSGTNGRILKSSVTYNSFSLTPGPAEEIFSNSARLTGNVTSNSGIIKEIQFEYGTNYKFDNVKSVSPGTIEASKSVNMAVKVDGLLQETTYQYRIKAIYEGKTVRSEIREFKTKKDYELKLHYNQIDMATNTVKASGLVVSNKAEISGIEFQYGTAEAPFSKAVSATPAVISGMASSDVVATITGLEANTKYQIRIKAVHEGDIIYSQSQEFITYPEFQITLNSVGITESSASFSAYVSAISADIKDLVFEYGSPEFEHEAVADPGTVAFSHGGYISATTGDLDPSKTYYYRVKGVMGEKTIYSKTGVFNFSAEPIVIPSGTNANANRTVNVEGLINPGAKYLSNIRFEYGLDQEFDLSVPASPSALSGNFTSAVTAVLDNLVPGSSYTFRIKAQEGSKTLISDAYTFATEAAVVIAQDVLSLQVINETCLGKNNGSFILAASEEHDFTASINGEEHEFSSQLKLEDLAPGLYNVCVTAKSVPDFQQCYDFNIAAGNSIAGMAVMEQTATTNFANISMQEGTAPFTVSLNGRVVAEYFSNDFSVKVKQGDKLQISSMASCEGVFAFDVDLKNNLTAYPNPASSVLNILIPYAENEEVNVELYNNHGSLISSGMYTVSNNTVSVSVESLASGFYFAVVKLDSPKTIKFSKK
ncbi:T9SS type A sorting domain-containing protein [Salinimicrobium flavum]|uniref:YCF48-related protein n=1 Tax=Salinimicrobium flavum TaxID=1737065 RepID=A0ABW5IZW2_9FLAO